MVGREVAAYFGKGTKKQLFVGTVVKYAPPSTEVCAHTRTHTHTHTRTRTRTHRLRGFSVCVV